MATYTEKLGLKLPSQTDFYNVDDFNENFRKLDQNTAQSGDIQHVLTLADPIRSNRAPTTADAQYAGKLWVVPKMIFNNMMPNAITQVAGNWHTTAATASVSGNAATIVGDGAASTIVGEVNMTAVKANDIVYIAAKMTVTADANGAVLELLCGDEVIATTSMNIPVAGNNIRLIGHTKVGAAGALKLRTTAMYNSASAQLGKGVTISDITILDLTADMCQNFAGIEFSKDAATTYIDTYGNFQTKTYELSECWWICRGSYGGQYSWQRYDDYTNAVMNKYSTDYQNSKATTAEAQSGTNDEHWMTPLKTQQFLTNRLATQSEAQAGTDNTKWMTPARVRDGINILKASQSDVNTGTDNTKWVSPFTLGQKLLPIIQGVKKVTNLELLVEYNTAGSRTISFPADTDLVYGIAIGGGGGGGGPRRGNYVGPGGGGGGGAQTIIFGPVPIANIKNKTVVVASGGTGGKGETNSVSASDGGNGGTTVCFGSISACGGFGGKSGGSGGEAYNGATSGIGVGGSGAESADSSRNGGNGIGVNVFTLLSCCAGGGGGSPNGRQNPGTGGLAGMGNGGTGGTDGGQREGSIGTNGTAGKVGSGGGGGGSGARPGGGRSGDGGAGGSGYVAIYIIRRGI